MDNKIARYNNGNYQVTIEKDGTKTRICYDSVFKPTRPETLDINISNHCVHNCPFCYIDASTDGKHGKLDLPILLNLKKGTEIAINYAKHPGLYQFLCRMKDRGIISNMTVNQKDLDDEKTRSFITMLLNKGLIHGLGVSVNSIDTLYRIDNNNVVYHVIAGITPIIVIEELIRYKSKILILGYKTKGRGENITPRLERIQNEIKRLLTINEGIISFDNNALQQLGIKDLVSDEIWSQHFMGDEGAFSMYVDTVERKYYVSSTHENGYDINDFNIEQLFKHIQKIR